MASDIGIRSSDRGAEAKNGNLELQGQVRCLR
jgi:hypothetical protein